MEWDVCEVFLEVLKKESLGFMSGKFTLLEKWVTRLMPPPVYGAGGQPIKVVDPEYLPVVAELMFTVDPRIGEDPHEKEAEMLGQFVWVLCEDGWEAENTDRYAGPIRLRRPIYSSTEGNDT